jgi:hypothetical protein
MTEAHGGFGIQIPEDLDEEMEDFLDQMERDIPGPHGHAAFIAYARGRRAEGHHLPPAVDNALGPDLPAV